MAKSKMMCPFSKRLCVECPQYRGRHYYLCYNHKYRGYLGGAEGKSDRATGRKPEGERFEVSKLIPKGCQWLVLNDFAERRKE